MSKLIDAFKQGKEGKAFHMKDDGTLPPVMLRNDLTDRRREVDNVLDVTEGTDLTVVALLTGIRAELRYMNDKADYS